MLKGIGTRASKSRLTTDGARSLLECLSTCAKGRQEGFSYFWGRRRRRKRTGRFSPAFLWAGWGWGGDADEDEVIEVVVVVVEEVVEEEVRMEW